MRIFFISLLSCILFSGLTIGNKPMEMEEINHNTELTLCNEMESALGNVSLRDLEYTGNNEIVQPMIVPGYGTGDIELPSVPKVYGYLSWMDDSGKQHPLQYTAVQICERENGTGLSGILYTNENGFYEYSLGTNQYEVYIKVFSNGGDTAVYSSEGSLYVYEVGDLSYDGTASVELSATVTMANTLGQAFQVLQATITAAKYAKEMNNGVAMPAVRVVYPHNIIEKEGCFYTNSEQTIYIVGKEGEVQVGDKKVTLASYASWDVIMHEYGHHVQYTKNITASLGGTHSASDNLIARYGKLNGIRLAWAEAYATVFGQLAQEYYADSLSNILSVADQEYSSYNTAHTYIEYGGYNYYKGEGYEGATINLLYDLYDSTNDIQDKIAWEHQVFWNNVMNSKAVSFSEFVNYLYDNDLVDSSVLGENLAVYGFAANNLRIEQGLVRPKLVWDARYTGEDSGDSFYIRIYNENGKLLLKEDAWTQSFTLSNSQIWELQEFETVFVVIEWENVTIPSTSYLSKTFTLDTSAL